MYKEITIKNFKSFKHLDVKDLGLVNLITGDNNAGKTNFLEALLLDDDNLKWVRKLHLTLCRRDIHFHAKTMGANKIDFPQSNYFNYLLNDPKLPLEINSLTDKLSSMRIEQKAFEDLENIHIDAIKRNSDYENLKNWLVFFRNNILDETMFLYNDDISKLNIGYQNFIAFNLSYGHDLSDFSTLIDFMDYNVKKEIIDALELFIDDIVDFSTNEVGIKKLVCIARKSQPEFIPLTTFGDGVQKFFRYIVEIVIAKYEGYNSLMIDEIDTGFHYFKLKEMWEVIFKMAKNNGVQIFATTHSEDCLKAFVDAGEEWESKSDLRLVRLSKYEKNGQNLNNAATFQFEEVKSSVYTNTNIRGGNPWR